MSVATYEEYVQRTFQEMRKRLVALPEQGADSIDAAIGSALNDCERTILDILAAAPTPTGEPEMSETDDLIRLIREPQGDFSYSSPPADSLEAAWAEAEAALPEKFARFEIAWVEGRYHATAWARGVAGDPAMSIADTPAAALRDLAEKLR